MACSPMTIPTGESSYLSRVLLGSHGSGNEHHVISIRRRSIGGRENAFHEVDIRGTKDCLQMVKRGWVASEGRLRRGPRPWIPAVKQNFDRLGRVNVNEENPVARTTQEMVRKVLIVNFLPEL